MISSALLIDVLQIIASICARFLYNVYFHPLARFPGPWLYRASSIPIAIAQIRGNFHEVTKAAHDRYGEVVRMAPNELCYISPQAVSDIFTRRNGLYSLPKDENLFNTTLMEPGTLTIAKEDEHPRLRHMLAPAFSTKALQEQETILQRNVDLLIGQMHDRAARNDTVDLKTWYNFTSFDIVGDFAFGQSFGSLERSRPHEWVQFVLDYIQVATYMHVARRFYPLDKLLLRLVPRAMMEHRAEHTRMALEIVQQRIDRDPVVDRRDFVHYMLRAVDPAATNEKGGGKKDQVVSTRDVEKQANILILAGSDSTATTLSFATYFLTQRPSCMVTLRRELRANFSNESEIDTLSLDRLPYLHAVVQETLRMRHPFPSGFGRQTRKMGSVVDGQFLPANTVVNIHLWSLFNCESYFKRPDHFAPERWLGNEEYADDAREVFQPFSIGPRNCLGQKFALNTIKLVLARMVWNFDLALAPEARGWLEHQPAFVSWEMPPLLLELKLADVQR
ncbi:cytochrome P450 [Aspergillus homomorphus CBS 101889]|uniref:Cytochrome P450 n=1 Tax=Aspergillus homomorphus (strain CBS 101889) TaxID=1450537 RepID=A0A395I508_ASPHC|nr:cytochrome P450 [Aspergillus homomorphus CBS 101889]RAL15170.1 cytochrome P450 [Aspergillus homomorphus CBS 101889]